MAQITDERLKAMEAEMDRFEQEILSPEAGDLPRMIIGSHTFNNVSAQLKMLRGDPQSREAWVGEAAHEVKADMKEEFDEYSELQEELEEQQERKAESSVTYMPPPPPPPPSITGSEPSSGPRPSGPPAPSPAFLPPQLKQRPPPPPPPPNRPPLNAMPRMRPPPPPPQQFPNMMSRPPGGPHGPQLPMGMHTGGHPAGPMLPQHRGPPPGPRLGPGPGPYGPPPGPMGNFGPRPMGHVRQAGPMMYGVSTGEIHKGVENQSNVFAGDTSISKPKVIYSAPPTITITKVKKKKKEKKAAASDVKPIESPASEPSQSQSQSVVVAKATASVHAEPEEDLMEADMEIDNTGLAGHGKKEKKEKKKKFIRYAAGTAWEDQTLSEWDPDDFRLFCGDLGNEVTDECLARAFSKFPTFVKARVVRDKRTQKTKGYGFVSFRDPNDYVRAIREMNGKYVGNRPIKLRKSNWRDRNIEVVKRKEKEKKRLGLK